MRADAYLESALTHARNLSHFFSCNLKTEDLSRNSTAVTVFSQEFSIPRPRSSGDRASVS